MSLFRPSLLLLALSCVAMTQVSAQSPAALAENLKVREARVNILRDEIKNIDLRIEERLSIVLDQLASVVDSRESMSRVAAMKQRTAEALGRAVTEYRRRRAALVEDIRRPALGLTTRQIEEIIRVLDLKTEKRVEEILKLQRSIPTTEVVRPGTKNLETQEVFLDERATMRQNQRVNQRASAMQTRVESELRNSISRLDRENRSLNSRLAQVTDSERRRLIQEEIARNTSLIADRQRQLNETQSAAAGEGQPLTAQGAREAERLLQKNATALQADFALLFRRYNEFIPALAQMNAARRLATGRVAQ